MTQTKLRNVQYDISAYTNSASSVMMPVGFQNGLDKISNENGIISVI